MQAVSVHLRWNDSSAPATCPITGVTHTPYIGNYPFLAGTSRPILMQAIRDSAPDVAQEIEALSMQSPASLSLQVSLDDEWISLSVLYDAAEDTSGKGLDGFWNEEVQTWGPLYQATRYSLMNMGALQGEPLPCSVKCRGAGQEVSHFVPVFPDALDELFRYQTLSQSGYWVGRIEGRPHLWCWVPPTGQASVPYDNPTTALESAWADAVSKAEPVVDTAEVC